MPKKKWYTNHLDKINSSVRFIVPIGLLLILIHFVIILCYAAPKAWVTESMREESKGYVLPVFHQSWNLFAPNVYPHTTQLYSRYYRDGWTEWTRPDHLPEMENHFIMKRTMRSIMRDLSVAINSNDFGLYYIDSIPQTDKTESGYSFMLAMRYANQYDKYLGLDQRDSLQIKIEFLITPPMNSDLPIDTTAIIFNPYSLGYVE